jgi:DNA-binding HxlR family transcriptional regulator
MNILVVIYNEGPKFKGDLVSNITKSNHTIDGRINALEEAGLLEIVNQDHPPWRKFIHLTEKGRKIAELAVKMNATLEG